MGFLRRSSGRLYLGFLILLFVREPVAAVVFFVALLLGGIAGCGAWLVQRARARDASQALRVPLNLES
jgi:hypothetical protein